MERLGYLSPKGEKYLLYALTAQLSSKEINLSEILKDKQVQKGSPLEGAPIYLTGKELQEYCVTTK